jgi:dihydroflavonol-4-reductase
MKCFVTGATGFLGSHVARQLLARGADLRLLVRPTSRLDNIADIPAERVVGDLRDPESLRKGMSGCEFVFHVAADYRLWSLHRQELYDSNVEGTRNILRRREIPECGALFTPAALPPWVLATTAASRMRSRQ